MIRNLWLVNGNDKRFDFADQTKYCFFNTPTGLGFSITYSVSQVGNNEIITDFVFNLNDLTGELIFYSRNRKQYQDYFDFLKFISIDPLYLYYQPPEMESYRCRVKVSNLEKSELERDGSLKCSITIKRETPWSSSIVRKISARSKSGSGKSYPYSRPHYYGLIESSNILMSNDSMIDLPFTIEIIGTCVDPMYNLYDEYGNKYGAGKINGTYDYIYINSEDENEEIILKRGDEVIYDAFNYQDLTVGKANEVRVTFLKIKPGTSVLKFSMDNEFVGKVNISWRNLYVSV